MINPLGLGTGCMQNTSDFEIEEIVECFLASGGNFFDLCGGGANVYRPIGKVLKNKWNDVHMQLHFGAVYDDEGKYAWTRDLDTIKRTIEKELDELQTDHIDYGYIHCVDTIGDYENYVNKGIVDYICELQRQRVVRNIAFSSHSPKVANRILDEKICNMIMFSINPAFEYELSGRMEAGNRVERQSLFERCRDEGVGIVVMKPFFGGKLLDDMTSPFKQKLTDFQCISFALKQPGVIAVVPGVKSVEEARHIYSYHAAQKVEKDYSVLDTMVIDSHNPECIYCNHCHPCPQGLDIALINKYFDLAQIGDEIAVGHYKKLSLHASDCIGCGLCNKRCPFHVDQSYRMKKIRQYFEC